MDIFIILPYIAQDVMISITISVKSPPSNYSEETTIGGTTGLSAQNDYEELEDILQGWIFFYFFYFFFPELSHKK